MRTRIFILSVVVSVGVGSARADLIWESGHHEFSEGNEGEIRMYNDATADITGGTIGILWGQDSSSINVFEGSTIDLLRPNDYSEAKVYGGEIQVIFALASSQTDVYGGTIDEIDATDLSTVSLYVESHEINPNGGSFNHGFVTGIWLEDGSSFGINLRGIETINHLNFVPEPVSLVIFTVGGLGVLRTRKKFQ